MLNVFKIAHKADLLWVRRFVVVILLSLLITFFIVSIIKIKNENPTISKSYNETGQLIVPSKIFI